MDCREVGTLGPTRDEELLRAATNIRIEHVAGGCRAEKEELSDQNHMTV